MTCNFTAGQRVVCVNDDWPEVFVAGVLFPPRVPMLNEVLTVTSVTPCSAGTDHVYLQFKEIPAVQVSGHVLGSVAYVHTHFRPLQERKADISIFRAMLTPAGRIPVDA